MRNKIIILKIHEIFAAGCEAINNQTRLNLVSKFKTVKCEIYPRYDFNGLVLVLDINNSVCGRNLKNDINV